MSGSSESWLVVVSGIVVLSENIILWMIFFSFVFSKHWPLSCVFTGWRTVPTGDYLW